MKTQNKPIETEDEYRQALASHDWWSAKSDDYSVYQEGQINLGRLYQASLKFDPDLTIRTAIKPRGM